jgi:hypothetical protein
VTLVHQLELARFIQSFERLGDEVLEVHKRLAKFEGSNAELLESHSV